MATQVLGATATEEEHRRLGQPPNLPSQFEENLCRPLYEATDPPLVPDADAESDADAEIDALVTLYRQKKKFLRNDVLRALREKLRESTALLQAGATVASFVAKKRRTAPPPVKARVEKQPPFDAARKKKSVKRARNVLRSRQQALAILGDD